MSNLSLQNLKESEFILPSERYWLQLYQWDDFKCMTDLSPKFPVPFSLDQHCKDLWFFSISAKIAFGWKLPFSNRWSWNTHDYFNSVMSMDPSTSLFWWPDFLSPLIFHLSQRSPLPWFIQHYLFLCLSATWLYFSFIQEDYENKSLFPFTFSIYCFLSQKSQKNIQT